MASSQDAITSLPWELIADCLTLSEVLTTRLVSHAVSSWVHDLSPRKCGALLEQALLSRNVHFVPLGSWEDALQDKQGIADMLSRDSSQYSSTPLDITLRCFRVLKSIPIEVAVAFNGKYGRHCIPLEYNSERQTTEPKLHQACSRRECKTCTLCIPRCDDPGARINRYLTVLDEDGKQLDLSRFYNKCVPNLPPDLICPSCQCSDKRTLVMSVLSYPSDSAAAKSNPLTYTPHQQEDAARYSQTKTETDDNKEEQMSPRKRQRIDTNPTLSFAFPPIRNDLSIPTQWAPPEQDGNSKHAIAIHCVSCNKFGVVAPAGPCFNERFPCHERGRQVTVVEHATTIGGIYVRTKCSKQNCMQAASCETCSREAWHPCYERQQRDGGIGRGTVLFKTRCEHCNLRYCNDVECAWLTSVCHHS